jgi:hypothetical protein
MVFTDEKMCWRENKHEYTKLSFTLVMVIIYAQFFWGMLHLETMFYSKGTKSIVKLTIKNTVGRIFSVKMLEC